MSNAISDFMVHIDDELYPGERRLLEADVMNGACVVSAHIPDSTPHLMMVVYDSECTHAREILGQVRNMGVHATML
jgi:hypothetical protein